MNTPEEIAPDALGRALEDRGFDSLWVGEHSHIPASRATPYPAGGELPPQYLRMMDPFVSLMLAATATTSLLVGTGVALPLERDVFALAKAVATLDRLSRGRFQFGVGVGWNREELANCRNVPWAQRYRALADCVAALKSLWSNDPSEHHGAYFDFDAVWSQPKPHTEPHPPILCGTGGKLGTAHAVDWADAWMPMDISLGDSLRAVTQKIGKFREAVAAAGRERFPITIVTFGNPTLETLTAYRELGIERAVVGPGRKNWADPTTTLAFLDSYQSVVAELR